jgi:hypothetical protein
MRVVNSTSTLDRTKRAGMVGAPGGSGTSNSALNQASLNVKREWEKIKAEKERLAEMKKVTVEPGNSRVSYHV